MADQMRDVFDRDPCARQQRDETVPQLSWCPFFRLEPSALGHLAEGTPDVGRVERGAKLRREDKIIVGPSCRVAHATLGLPASVRSKCDYAFVRESRGCYRRSPALSRCLLLGPLVVTIAQPSTRVPLGTGNIAHAEIRPGGSDIEMRWTGPSGQLRDRARSSGTATSGVLGCELPGVDSEFEYCVVALVLVSVRFGKSRHGTVETVIAAEVARHCRRITQMSLDGSRVIVMCAAANSQRRQHRALRLHISRPI